MTERDDDAASIREDSFLGRLVPQAVDHLAGQHTGDFDAETSRTRFRTWLTEHTDKPAGTGGYEGPAVSEAGIVDEAIDWEVGEEQAGHEDSAASVVPLPFTGRAQDLASAEEPGAGRTPGGRQPLDEVKIGLWGATGSGKTETYLAALRHAEEPGTGQAPRVRQPTAEKHGEVKIGLWGAPASGKTTYLAALRHALHVDRANGRWNIYPGNDVSAEFMVRATHSLVADHRFPEATVIDDADPLRWHFVGDLTGSRFDKRKLRRRAPVPSEFVLGMSDVSGEAYASETEYMPAAIARWALDNLVSAQGLLYFFDPITERENRHSMAYLNRTIIALSHRIREAGQLINGYLPHHVAVCITKFDHPQVFEQAQRRGIVSPGPDGTPWVHGKDAETLFNMICDNSFWDDDERDDASSAWFVRDELRTRFHPDRIHYFATSAIGFYRPLRRDPATGQPSAFDPRDYENVWVRDGRLVIRGPIAPVNVLEPLLTLQDGISGIARTHMLRPVPSEYTQENRRLA